MENISIHSVVQSTMLTNKDSQNRYYRHIDLVGAQKFFETAVGIIEARCPKGKTSYGCTDSRIGWNHYHRGASGILLPTDEVVRELEYFNATLITSHESCTAVKDYLTELGYQNITPTDIEEEAQEFAWSVSHKAGITYGGHLKLYFFDQNNPDSTDVVYFATGPFDPYKADIPKGTTLTHNPAHIDLTLSELSNILQNVHKKFSNLRLILISNTLTGPNGTKAMEELCFKALKETHICPNARIESVILPSAL